MSTEQEIHTALARFVQGSQSLEATLRTLERLLALTPQGPSLLLAALAGLDGQGRVPAQVLAALEDCAVRATDAASAGSSGVAAQAPASSVDAGARTTLMPNAAAGTAATTDADSCWSTTGTSGDHAPLPNEPQPGDVLKDRFELVEVLGRGGMSVVFKALDRRRLDAKDRQPYVALKLLNEGFRRHPQSLMALQREAAKAQRLRHPNIIDVYDFDRDEQGRWFISMELLVGITLDRIIRDCRPNGMEPGRAWPLIEQIGLGLTAAHGVSPPIVHCDLKPGNVFVSRDGRVKIFDFGIARAVRPMEDDGQQATQFDAGVLKALTPGYASTEMLAGEDPDPRDDIFALAVIAYELLGGGRPFGRRGTALQALATGRRPERIRALTRRQWQGLASGLSLHRGERCPSAQQLLDALRPRAFRPAWPLVAASLAGLAVLAGALALLVGPGSGSTADRPRMTASDHQAGMDAPASAVMETGAVLPADSAPAPATTGSAKSPPDDPSASVEPSPPRPGTIDPAEKPAAVEARAAEAPPRQPAPEPAPAPAPTPEKPDTLHSGQDTAPGNDADQADALAYWQLIKDERDPAIFEAFLERFDDPVLGILARVRLRELNTRRDPTPAPVVEAPSATPQESAPEPATPAAKTAALARAREIPPRLIQQALKDLGFYTGVVDGIPGPGTRAAIRRWRQAGDADQTGELRPKEIVALIREAAEAGHAGSRNTFAMMAAEGIGIVQDDTEALRLFELAAADGHAYAAYNLGVMYRDGRAVEPSDARARHYFQLARAGGHPRAADALADLDAAGK